MTKIHPSAVIDKDAILDADVTVGPFCSVGAHSRIGKGTILDSHVSVGEHTVIGCNNHLLPQCVVGAIPQILGHKPGDPCGDLIIGDDNTLRENVTIHRGMHAGASTIMGNRNLIMVGAHVGHDCIMGDHIVVSNHCQLSGHCKVEDGVWISGMSGLHQFVTIHKWAYVAGMTAVTHDIPPFMVVSGSYPTRIRGVNARGVKRAGLEESVEKSLCQAYRRLYRRSESILETAEAMLTESDINEQVRDVIEAIQRASKHRYGRYLETFR